MAANEQTAIRNYWLRSAAVLSLGLALALAPAAAHAQRIGEELASRLNAQQERAYVLYLRAKAQFDLELDRYWEAVEERREHRRRKRRSDKPFVADDFIAVQPPRYDGPAMPKDVARILAELAKKEPPKPDAEPMPVLSDFLLHASREYGFVPQRTSEEIFKRRYADESLALGLTKDQVVKVFALETGGRGTYDMQAGIDPESKRGTAISSALGYAQLLAANSVNEVVNHGETFIARLEALRRQPGTTRTRSQQLTTKITALRRMIRAARRVPNSWSAHVALSRQPKGLGIHALNLDADIGPLLQTIKLKGVRDYAEKAGRPSLSGPEIELMNLAGPQTGLDMMEPVGLRMPTTNFFSRRAYGRNPIVRDKSSADLLKALEERMDANLKKAGSIAFARAFDEAMARNRRSAQR